MRIRSVRSPYRMTTAYGWILNYPLNKNRKSPGRPVGNYGFHTGRDYVSDDGFIIAPQDSIVTSTGYDEVNGNFLVLESKGFRDWFSHIKHGGYLVKPGDAVSIGQNLAMWGDTGAADGAHNHHSLRVNGIMRDPEAHITKETPKEKRMDKESVTKLALYLRLTAGDSVDKANANSEEDVKQIMANPAYAAGLAEQIYKGSELFRYKASHYDALAQELKELREQGGASGEFVVAPTLYVKK